MSDAPAREPELQQGGAPTAEQASNRIAELNVSGHLMTLETGLFCIVQLRGDVPPGDRSGLPGVRVSAPPGEDGRPHAITVSTFRDDGWLGGPDDAALVRVSEGPAQVLVTIYQSPSHAPAAAPRLQVLRLSPAEARPNGAAMPASEAGPGLHAAHASAEGADLPLPELVAHVARAGDLTARFGEWIGRPGSRQWIEGFGIAPQDEIGADAIEYQAVLGRGWLSPWVAGGQFCGSRGMALPLLGLRVRLRGEAAETHQCSYSATFVDGSKAGPSADGEACEADSLAPLEAFQIELRRKPALVGGNETGAVDAPSRGVPGNLRVTKSARRPR